MLGLEQKVVVKLLMLLECSHYSRCAVSWYAALLPGSLGVSFVAARLNGFLHVPRL